MLNKIFNTEELPNFKVYETAQKVVKDYMDKNSVKIAVVAAELETTQNVLYRQLNPSDTTMPLSADRIIAITKLTNDYRIIEALNTEFDLVSFSKDHIEGITSVGMMELIIKSQVESNDVFATVTNSLADGKITKAEQSKNKKEIQEAIKALMELEKANDEIEIVEE